jgi:hypothetical protein
LKEREEVIMGIADAEIHVLDFNKCTSTHLLGRRYRIAQDHEILYSFDSTPLRKGFVELANGALFVAYADFHETPNYELNEKFHCDLDSTGGSRWEYQLTNSDAAMLLVLVLPAGYTAPVANFNFTPRGVQSTTDSRIRFLFIEKPLDGCFRLRWKTIPISSSIDKEVQLAFDEISKIPELPTVHRYKPEEKPVSPSVTGRTGWDVAAWVWTSGHRRWLIAIAVPLLLVLLAISHVQTDRGKCVSLFGICLYTKGG